MESSTPRKSSRIHDRRLEVVREALRSRKFSTEELTKQAVEFILTGLTIERNRDVIIKNVTKRDNQNG